MKLNLRKLALPVFASLLLSTPALATDVLRAKGLGVLRGEVTAYDPETKVVTFVTEAGQEHKIPAADLDRLSSYKLAKNKVDVGTAEGLVKLGNFARTIELYAYAGRHYNDALQLDPKLKTSVEKEQAQNRKEAAEYCMRLANEAIAKNDSATAEKWLTTLINKLPNEPLAGEASDMLGEHYEKNHEAKDDELESKFDEAIKKDLATGKKRYDSMLKNIKDGLGNSRNTSASKRHFEDAWKDGEKAMSELDKVEKKRGKESPELSELFDGYRVLITEHMVDSQLHLAAQYATQTSYQQALKTINAALSIDTKNSELLAARARVEEAVSNNGGLFRRWW
ncbi:MAG: tetratricopeptide (TPR) repeat protein [Planctomycetota bacterium]|jgi:tetratricopeptide (TPR) repeat protein